MKPAAPEPNSPQQIFASLNIIFYAMLAGQLMFFCVAFYLREHNEAMHQIMQYAVPAWTILIILGAPFIYSVLIKRVRGKDVSLLQKMLVYRMALIVKIALLEGAGMICLLGLLLAGDQYYAYMFLAVFMAYLLSRPKVSKAAYDLQLNQTEQRQLRGNAPLT